MKGPFTELVSNLPDGEDEEWREEQPAVAEEPVGFRAGHVPHVGGQPLGAVEPHDGDALEEGDVHQRDRRPVVINQLEDVNASLWWWGARLIDIRTSVNTIKSI